MQPDNVVSTHLGNAIRTVAFGDVTLFRRPLLVNPSRVRARRLVWAWMLANRMPDGGLPSVSEVAEACGVCHTTVLYGIRVLKQSEALAAASN